MTKDQGIFVDGRVYDMDGEFMLVEAALVLPPWLNPETSENRVSSFFLFFLLFSFFTSLFCWQVFIHKGKVHIIPLPQTPAEMVLFPSGEVHLEQAIALIRGPNPTEASQAIQEALLARIQG